MSGLEIETRVLSSSNLLDKESAFVYQHFKDLKVLITGLYLSCGRSEKDWSGSESPFKAAGASKPWLRTLLVYNCLSGIHRTVCWLTFKSNLSSVYYQPKFTTPALEQFLMQ